MIHGPPLQNSWETPTGMTDSPKSLLCDSVLNYHRNQWGIDALATDPVDPNKVYIAAGMYTISWDPNPGSILRSSDKGNTWQSTTLPFKVGGNMPGRGTGEVSFK